MRDGRNKAIDGNSTIKTKSSRPHNRYGKPETATSFIVVPAGATPNNTKRLRPNGGVMPLISSARSMMIPNQIKSNPSAWATGKKIGIVNIMIDTCSMNMPMNNRIANIAEITITGDHSRPLTTLIMPDVAPEKASSCEKVEDATTISNTMPVTFSVPRRDL